MKPYYQTGGIQLYLGDCREVLPELGEYDLVVTDPPYGTGGWRRTESGAGSDFTSGTLMAEDWDDGAVDWLKLLNGCPVLTFWPPARTSYLLNAANACGLTKHRALYMKKRDPMPQPGGRMRWSVEPIWALSRPGFVLISGDDVFEASTPRLGRDADATGHPYEKPLEVVRWLIAKTQARTILDPFMGSGTSIRAAMDLRRGAIGIERDEQWLEVAARRLSQQVLPLEVVG